MPSYNAAAVSDAVIAFKKGITLQQGRALRDNPIAIAEGAAGAPRLRGLAAMTAAEYSDISPLVVTAGGTSIPSYAYSGSFSNTTTTETTYVTAGTITITARATGTFRFSAVANWSSGLSNPRATEIRLLKNGVELDSVATGVSGGSSQTLTLDAAAVVGDTFEWQVRRQGFDQGSISAISVSGSFDQIITVGLPIKQSEL